MKTVQHLIAAALVAATAVALPVSAQEKKQPGPNRAKSQASSPKTDAVANSAMAERLARMGEQKKDPVLLIAAARILQEIGSRPAEHKPQSTGQGDARSPRADRTPEALIARAKELASGRADLIALADEAGKLGTRGATQGPQRARNVVRSRGADIYTVVFNGGEPAAVAISGDGDSDLDLEVYDQNGNLICKADGPSDDEICRWNPRWTGPFRIRVVNLGIANEYRLLTN